MVGAFFGVVGAFFVELFPEAGDILSDAEEAAAFPFFVGVDGSLGGLVELVVAGMILE